MNPEVTTGGGPHLELICEDLTVPENIGMIFRLAEAFSVRCVHLSEGCLSLPNQKIAKVARGALRVLPHRTFSDGVALIMMLRGEGYRITALETGADSMSLRHLDFRETGKLALVLGSEKYGIRPETLAVVDEKACIPLSGLQRSINVANALAIALYEIGSQGAEGRLQQAGNGTRKRSGTAP